MTTLADYREHVEAALAYNGGTHTFDDVREMVESGEAQFWPGPHSVIITEVVKYPRRKELHVFLAGGSLVEIEAMVPMLETWAIARGCTTAALIGRRGWERTFLTRTGWHTGLVRLEKTLV